MQTILAVDPDTDFLKWVVKHLGTQNVRVLGTTNPEQALAAAASEKPDIILAELHIQPINGMEMLRRLRQSDPNALVILNTGFPPTNAVIEAMKLGAYEFLKKESLAYELRPVVEEALKARETMRATAAVPALENIQATIIGQSPAMQSVFKLIGRASRSIAPVMVTGESGCGKEVVANAIHKFSARTHKDFIAINCAAIPESLLESELFGHEKGSFTGAVAQRIGRFEQGDGGTLFLDEIGEMPMQVQSKILRVLQEGEFSRVGGSQTLRTDVRILAATNKNLEEEVENGRFREDLFYRLNVIRIHLPPLRERIEDVVPLANYFLQRLAQENRHPRHRLSEDAAAHLEAWHWPGNVRELENTLRRACVLATSDVLMQKDIPLGTATGQRPFEDSAPAELAAPPAEPAGGATGVFALAARSILEDPASIAGQNVLAAIERELILEAARLHEGSNPAAAKLLGLTPAVFTKKLKAAQG